MLVWVLLHCNEMWHLCSADWRALPGPLTWAPCPYAPWGYPLRYFHLEQSLKHTFDQVKAFDGQQVCPNAALSNQYFPSDAGDNKPQGNAFLCGSK